jgi:hypothetical protein
MIVGLLTVVAFGGGWSAMADDRVVEPVGELFIGGTKTNNTWIGWAGMVKSLSSSLYDEGMRLRMLTAYGRYHFTTDGQTNHATPALFEITPGYQFKIGPLISKAYLGLHGEHHKLARPDPFHKAAGMGYGLKVLSENWVDLPMNSFASLDGSFSTLNIAYQGMARVGMARFVRKLSVGPEIQIVGNEQFYQFRVGGFARLKLQNGSVEGSAGYAEDYDKKSTPYFSMSWLKQF